MKKAQKRTIIISSVLPKLLKERNMTAKSLAASSGISASTVSTWILPDSRPRNIEDVAAAADVLGVSLTHLLFGTMSEPGDLSTIQADTILDGVFRLKIERLNIPDGKVKK